MNEIIYLEPDEEITSVIDRLRNAANNCLSLVVPRGSGLAQSIVNLKLLKKSANDMDKELSLVSTDRISRNLASQIGLTVYSKVSEAEGAIPKKAPIDNIASEASANGYKVNSYYNKKDDEGDLEEDPVEEGKEEDAKDGAEEEENSENEEIKQELAQGRDEEEEEEEAEEEASRDEPTEEKKSTRKEEPAKPKEDQEEIKKDKNIPMNSHKIGLSKTKKIVIIASSVCGVILLALAYIFIPYADVSVQLKTENMTVEKQISVDPGVRAVDSSNLIVPGTWIEIEKEVSKTYTTTGKRDEGAKATGTITIINDYDSSSHKFPAGTQFLVGDKVFLSTADATVPTITNIKIIGVNTTWDPGTVQVAVTAKNPGDGYNIGPSTFSIAGAPNVSSKQKIWANSAAPMTGGVTKTVNIVSEDDLKNAAEEARKDAVASAKPELISKAKDSNAEIFESKISEEVISGDASKKSGDEADSFDYKVNIKLKVLSYSKTDVKNVLVDTAKTNLESDKMLINPDKSEVTTELVDSGTVENVITVKSSLAGKVGQKLASEEVKNLIKNKKFGEAKKTIENNQAVESASVKITPAIAKVPFVKSRIKVKFDYAQ